MNEDKLILAMTEDKRNQCADKYMITNTGFLDMRQQTICKNLIKSGLGIKGFFYGGYEEAERKVAIFIPEYIDIKNEADLHEYLLENPEESPIALIKAKHNGYKELSHRDYLGSLIGMGIKRESIGDILVGKDGADIIILQELAEFLLLNYGKAGRTDLELSLSDMGNIVVPLGHTEEKNHTVASLRLDNVIAAAFGVPRSNATAAIKSGLVFVNNLQADKAERAVNQGDKLVIRGKGKVILKEVGGNTRKDRIFITVLVMK